VRFTRLELLHWDIQANQVLVLQPGVNLLTGENGSGKTAILDAIKVVLGGTKIGGDRSVEDYLVAQAAPYVMIRLVADNRPPEGTRVRPFDRVQPTEADHFTLAVVFEASEEGYAAKWYFCPGDVSPLVRGFDGRAFTRKSDYTARLDKLGMGRSFRKLLCTQQGEIASLCGEKPEQLFDLLFDFIGGKEVLEEWEALRRAFDKQQRGHGDRARVLGQRETELDRLRERKRVHDRYRRELRELRLAKEALPLAGAMEAERRVAELRVQRRTLTGSRALELEREQQAGRELEALIEASAGLTARAEELASEGEALDARYRAKLKEQAGVDGEWQPLERLRGEVKPYPLRDLATLEAARTRVEDDLADQRRELQAIADREQVLKDELARLDEGLLTPPEEVDPFRAELRKHDIAHHLLMDLIEPLDDDESSRRALESYLGDFRFAVAVPNVESFVRATELAREYRFPFYVLAPDVRSRPPSKGEHPFLEQVRVQDPKYKGLVTRVLRGVRWLEGKVEDTLREPGTVLIDRDGYVLDRKGGRFQGEDRYFLGRSALERRRKQVEAELEELLSKAKERRAQVEELRDAQKRVQREIAEESRRLEWLKQQPEHRRLSDLRRRLLAELADLEKERKKHLQAVAAMETQRRQQAAKKAQLEERSRTARTRGEGVEKEVSRLAAALDSAEATLARSASAVPETTSEAARAYAEGKSPTFLQSTITSAQERAASFSEAERDENLPANVETLEKQVEAVRGELARLAAQVEDARQAAERAHEQYKTATKRVFRHYFAVLKQAGESLGFRLEGAPRPREDGRFAIDLQVAAGDKALVPYSSPSLSGGQKAALSMLMAMTTLRVHDQGGGAGFFLVDEPFSASDTHKIQELGAFLASTGAQYIVSMPTTEELRRCGSWLQAVWTCTQTRGGWTEDGTQRLAPPVKCSYVVDDG